MQRKLMACALLATVCQTQQASAEEVRVTPYRPTVTNSAGLSAPGWLELETGVARQNGKDGSYRNSMPYLAKLAFTPDFGVLLGGEAAVSEVAADKTRASGGGDTLLQLKHRFLLDADSNMSLGCEYGFKSPTAANGLGSGKTDYVVNGIFSKDIRGHSLDINLNATRLGDALAGESAYLYGLSGTVFRPLDDKWGVMAEVSGVMRKGTTAQSQVLAAVSYEWSNRLVLDAGLSAGISSAAHRVAVFAGMSMLLGQVR
ncbi:MAG TPA: hypothetical protein VK149_05235 [Sideroxyarcus sp.]|nr:hypothetical protein [Sideroxyarcus sp.]